MLNIVIQQAVVLLAMGWLLTLNARKGRHHPRLAIVTTGFWFGLAAIVCMLLPFTVAPGVLLDARSGVIFVAGVFGGPLSGALAALMAALCRLWIGGAGAFSGVLNIGFALVLGLAFRHGVGRGWLRINLWHLLPAVLVLHAASLLLIAALMTPVQRELMPEYIWPYLAVVVPLTLILTLILHDAEQRQREQALLEHSEARLRAITGALPDLMFVMNEQGRCLEVMASSSAQPYPVANNVIGKLLPQLFEPALARRFQDFIRRTLTQQGCQRLVYELGEGDDRRVFESRAQAMEAPLNEGPAAVVLTRDITQRERNETELRIAAVAFDSFEGMMITDAQTRILRVNRAFTEITGYGVEEVIGNTPAMLGSGQHDGAFYRQMWRHIHDHGHWQGEILNRRKSGHVYPQWLSISAVRDVQGEVSHYVASINDISQRKKDAERINHLAFYDGVTGLPNRRFLYQRLAELIDVQRDLSGLIFIDLDKFKHINDLWGLSVGDQVLQQAALRLSNLMHPGDLVARLGGDEFVVLSTGLPADKRQAAAHLEQLGYTLLSALEQPYAHEEHALRCGASLGMVLLEGQHASPDEQVQQAELAMYQAKSEGKGKLCFFDRGMQERVARRLRLEEDIQRGLDAGEFVAWYQPQFDHRGRIIGAEALARWLHPEQGTLAPGAFIDVAEGSGLMNRIDHMVLQSACRQMARWAQLSEFGSFTLSVNIGASRLYQAGFVEEVLQVFTQTGVDPGCIKLEITESMLLDDMPGAIDRMQALKAHGVRFAIDDFGTGYSSLLYLQRLPLDQLKIDQSFVQALPHDDNSLGIIKAIIGMAQSLGLEVIAEGVETDAQRTQLYQLGCHRYQGYLLSRPEPAERLQALMQSPRYG